MIHEFSTAAAKPSALPVWLTTIRRSFRNIAEILRNVGGTSGAEQLDP